LVEDDRPTAKAMLALLTRAGWEVTVARTLAEALARLDASTPDWVVLDLMLPDGDGTALLQRVRREGIRTRVAVTTGSIDAHRLHTVAQLGPDLFLTKPIRIADLFKVLNGWRDGH
jgi:DNA-binding response OmpR family regulator